MTKKNKKIHKLPEHTMYTNSNHVINAKKSEKLTKACNFNINRFSYVFQIRTFLLCISGHGYAPDGNHLFLKETHDLIHLDIS